MILDDINGKIIRHLRDGRKSYKEIAQALSITENTVRARVKKMQESEIFSISGLVNPIKISDHSVAFVGVKLSTMNLVEKGEEISKLKGVVSTAVVTGRFDIIMILMLKKEFDLLEFYTKEMSKVSGIQSVETFITYESFNLNLPYIF